MWTEKDQKSLNYLLDKKAKYLEGEALKEVLQEMKELVNSANFVRYSIDRENSCEEYLMAETTTVSITCWKQ